jgi:hypothetical protein
VTTSNGYENTLASVQRFMQTGLTVASVPTAVVNFDDERKSNGPADRATCTLSVSIDVWAVHDTASVSGYTATLVDSLAADVEKAVMQDTTRGGNARECEVTSVVPFRLAEGQPFVGATVSLTITYVHDIADPYVERN